MALIVLKLGDAEFVQFRNPNSPSGMPELPGEVVSVHQRPGADGTSVRLDGLKGRPFSMVGSVDVADKNTAAGLVQQYRVLRGTTQNIIWHSLDFQVAYETVYAVREVQATFEKLGAAVGGLSGNTINPYWVISNWVLEPIHSPADDDD